MTDQRLTAEQLAELRRLEQAAHAAPWRVEQCENDHGVTYQHIHVDPTAKVPWAGAGVADTAHYNAFEVPSFIAIAMEREAGHLLKQRTTPPTHGCQADADLIAALRNAAPLLLDAAEREAGLREALESMATRINDPDFSGDEAAWIARAALEGGPK